MTLDEYQTKALTTDSFKDGDTAPNVTDPAYISKILGLVGESGEVAEKFKKIIRNDNGVMSEEQRQELIKEVGDVLWYVAVLGKYLGADLETMGQRNLDKLADRDKRGVIKSKGDNR
jgi:NTP pyrophosphatase (non-canonical NTP hydrolase)